MLHAINALLGRLPVEALSTLRAYGGLQPYASRTEDRLRAPLTLINGDLHALAFPAPVQGCR